jgi:hypothetical protein
MVVLSRRVAIARAAIGTASTLDIGDSPIFTECAAQRRRSVKRRDDWNATSADRGRGVYLF